MPKKRKPYNKSTGRDYSGPDGDYAKFQASPKAKKERASRNKARREYEKEHGDLPRDVEIDHTDGNPKNNSKKNLKPMKRSKNRAKH